MEMPHFTNSRGTPAHSRDAGYELDADGELRRTHDVEYVGDVRCLYREVTG